MTTAAELLKEILDMNEPHRDFRINRIRFDLQNILSEIKEKEKEKREHVDPYRKVISVS